MKALLAAAALAASIAPVSAQQMACGPRAAIVGIVVAAGQQARASGVSRRGLLIEHFVGEDANWTVVVTDPSGRACIFDAGNSWEDVPPVVPGSDA